MVCRECKGRDDVPYRDLQGAPGYCEVCRRAVALSHVSRDAGAPLVFTDVPLGPGSVRQGSSEQMRDLMRGAQTLAREAEAQGDVDAAGAYRRARVVRELDG